MDRTVDRVGVHHEHGGLTSAVDPGMVIIPNHAIVDVLATRGSTIIGTCIGVVVPRDVMV